MGLKFSMKGHYFLAALFFSAAIFNLYWLNKTMHLVQFGESEFGVLGTQCFAGVPIFDLKAKYGLA